MWDAGIGEELHLLPVNAGDIYADWSPDGSLIATGGSGGEAKVWDSATGAELLDIRAHSGTVQDIGWFPSGNRFWTPGDGSAKVWKVAESLFSVGCQPTCPFSPLGDFWYSAAAWSPDTKQVARGFGDGTIKVWDMATGAELLSMHIEPSEEAVAVVSVEWSPDGDYILGGYTDGSTRIWDVSAAFTPGATIGEELLVLAGHNGMVNVAAWSPGGTRIVTASEDGTVIVWDISTALNTGAAIGEVLLTFSEQNNP